MSIRILQGDVFEQLPLVAPGSVDAVCTSPPYWMLRSYLPKGHPLKHLEIGAEKTPAAYVEKMVRVFRLVRDAMAEHATCWVNIGDTYTHQRGKRKPGDKHGPKQLTNEGSYAMPSATVDGVTEGNLCLIPQRLAIALQDDGWVVRSIVIWHKPSPMPASLAGWQWRRCRAKVNNRKQSVEKKSESTNGRPHGARADNGVDLASRAEWSDCPGCPKCKPNGGLVLRRGGWRPTSSYEPILMLAKSAKYFSDGEAVKKIAEESTVSRMEQDIQSQDGSERANGTAKTNGPMKAVGDGSTANLRDVWTGIDPLMRLRKDLTPEQRSFVVQKMLAAGSLES